MSDDGLIVLRTVRNLLAGNGPVFNAGERVETNTSTLWQYIIYIGALISGSRLETIALWVVLVFTTVALFIAALATAKLYQGNNRLLLLPFRRSLLIRAGKPPRRIRRIQLSALDICWRKRQPRDLPGFLDSEEPPDPSPSGSRIVRLPAYCLNN